MKQDRLPGVKSRASLLLILAFVLAALLLPMPFSTEDRLLHALEDAAHLPAFALLGWMWGRRRPRLGWGVAGLTALAALMELAQGATGRDPGVWDAVLSALGGSAGLVIARAPTRPYGVGGACAWAAFCALIALAPAVGVWADRRHARTMFPVLADFSSPLERGRWTVRGVRLRRVSGGGLDGRSALRMHVTSSKLAYPGAFMHDTLGDWREYTRLRVNIRLEGDAPAVMWVRVDDRADQPRYRDRAQQTIELRPGWNKPALELDELLITPEGRALDRAHPIRLGFFFNDPAPGQCVLLDHLRLE